MAEPPPPLSYAVPVDPTIDAEHLRLLSIFHFIVGPLLILMGCFPVIHLILGLAMMSGAGPFGAQAANQPGARWIGLFFAVLAGGMIAMFWALGGVTIYSGLLLRRHRGRTFSIIVAGLNCLCFPFGTVLGIFTLIVLLRRSVEPLYRSTARNV